MSTTISRIVSKYLTNEKNLKVMVNALLALDEEEDGAVIHEEDFEILESFGEV